MFENVCLSRATLRGIRKAETVVEFSSFVFWAVSCVERLMSLLNHV